MRTLFRCSQTKTITLLIIAVSFSLAALSLGSATLSFAQEIQGIFRSNTADHTIQMIMQLRLIRIAAAFLCGGALALSGTVLQRTLNNPMAGPSILGINASAALAVLICFLFFPGNIHLLPLFSVGGALAGSLLVFSLAAYFRFSRLTLILSGLALSSMLGAVSDTLLTVFPDIATVRVDFLVGSFAQITKSQLGLFAPLIILTVIATFFMHRPLNMLSLGETLATSLGMNVTLARIGLLFLSALLSALSISLCGLVGFLGLLTPHISRQIIRQQEKLYLPFTFLLGGTISLVCDTLARVLFSPYELPVGLLLSALGSPFFIVLLIKNRKRGNRV